MYPLTLIRSSAVTAIRAQHVQLERGSNTRLFRSYPSSTSGLLRSQTRRLVMRRVHGCFVGVEPIRTGRADNVTALGLAAQFGLVQHLGKLAGFRIVVYGLEQRAAGQHHHAVARRQMLLGAVD